jgi:carbon monoxide dehydrogenase subunit G
MWKKILLVPVVAIVAFAIYIAVQSPDFKVERSTVIDAPPEVAFAQVNDFHAWQAWSPWAKLDPKATNSFEGPSSGKGAIFKWAGNNEVGEGKMTITESKPSELIQIQLDFLKPMDATSNTEFRFQPEGKGTKVTWTMTGKNNFLGRAMCTIMNMQKTLEKTFDQGLASMKKEAEAKKDKPSVAEAAASATAEPTATAAAAK